MRQRRAVGIVAVGVLTAAALLGASHTSPGGAKSATTRKIAFQTQPHSPSAAHATLPRRHRAGHTRSCFSHVASNLANVTRTCVKVTIHPAKTAP